jgi:hypothetical protein
MKHRTPPTFAQRHALRLSWPALAALVAACSPSAQQTPGLAKTPDGKGPTILFDLSTRPLPEIPFPNDLATRPDPTSPTGKRLNASLVAPTRVEASLRRELNKLSGFGTYSPLSVSFDAPLDLANIKARHFQDPIDFADDVAYLVNLNPKSPHFGEPAPLDLGQGNFPLLVERTDIYFPNDYRSTSENILFEDINEDLNRNGTLDPGEDTDFDGVLDQANTITPNGDPRDDLAGFYERQTNTLLLRPLVPLEEESTYAVILTKRLVDEAGEPVRSPFPFINHVEQNEALRPLLSEGIFERLGLEFREANGGDVAFLWSFTTQSVTRDIVSIRDGLYGEGPFSYLADQFSVDDIQVDQLIDDTGIPGENLFVLPLERFLPLADLLAPVLKVPEGALEPLVESLGFVDYIVVGSFTGASFLADPDTGAVGYLDENGEVISISADDNARRSFQLDYQSGEALVGRDRVTFLMAVPKPTPGHESGPFPIVFYGHGYTSNRVQSLGFAGNLARQGFATVALEAVNHGLGVDGATDALGFAVTSQQGIGATWKALTNGRQKDMNGDGVGDSGKDFFTGYVFHTRDNVRQTVLDYMQMVRVLRSFDGEHRWPFDLDGDGQNELAGDFNADGAVDLGGPQNLYFAFGESEGGIVSEMLAATEPKLSAAAPVAGGGGLSDVGLRSLEGGIREASILRAMGLFVLGNQDPETGDFVLSMNLPDLNLEPVIPVAEMEPPRPGDAIVVENLSTGERFTAGAIEGGTFRVAVACDKGDRLQVRVLAPSGEERSRADSFTREVSFQFDDFFPGDTLVALGDGFGLERNTPEFRRLIGLTQLVLDPGDPINYAPHVFLDPLYAKIGDKELGRFSRPDQGTPIANRLLDVVTIGDINVPIATGIAYARAAGLVDFENPDPRFAALDDDDTPGITPNGVLLKLHVIEGLERTRRFAGAPFHDAREILADPDDFAEGTDCYNEYCLDASCQGKVTDTEVASICEGAPGTFRRAPKLSDLGLPPLRITVPHTDGTVSGLRFPYMEPKGAHGFAFSRPEQAFNVAGYMIHYVGRYFATLATELREDPCFEHGTCDFIAPAPLP